MNLCSTSNNDNKKVLITESRDISTYLLTLFLH